MTLLRALPLHELTPRKELKASEPPMRTGLGSDPNGLGVCCAYCWPALVTAYTVSATGLPCCHQCAGVSKKPAMPAFLLRSYGNA